MSGCTQIRRMLIRHSTVNMQTGELREERTEWVTQPCGAPLFGEDKQRGICNSCAKGWTHPENYPVLGTDLPGHEKPAHWFDANRNGFADEVQL